MDSVHYRSSNWPTLSFFLLLSSPKLAGLKDVIQVHFTLQRDAVLKQCSQWLKEAISEEYRQKLMKAIDELRLELDRV